MNIRQLAAGAAALALPLTMLGALPADAADRDRDRARILDISRVDVDDDGEEAKVRIRFSCESDRDGRLRVTLRQDGTRFSGSERVDCDGRDSETVELEGKGELEDGRAYLTVTLRAGDAKDTESERVRLHV